MKTIRVRDLPDSTLSTGVHLSCPMCGDQWSATRGDYFMLHPDRVLRCENDGLRLQLTRTLSREVPA